MAGTIVTHNHSSCKPHVDSTLFICYNIWFNGFLFQHILLSKFCFFTTPTQITGSPNKEFSHEQRTSPHPDCQCTGVTKLAVQGQSGVHQQCNEVGDGDKGYLRPTPRQSTRAHESPNGILSEPGTGDRVAADA